MNIKAELRLDNVKRYAELTDEIRWREGEIQDLEVTLSNLIEERQKVCSHDSVVQCGGGKWFSYQEWGYDPVRLECLDCGMFGYSNEYTQKSNKEWEKNPLFDNYLLLVKGKIVSLCNGGAKEVLGD
jgi:hypothetical protein